MIRTVSVHIGENHQYQSWTGDLGWNLKKKKNKKTKGAKRTVWTKTLYLSPQFSLSQFLSSALSHSLVFMLHATSFWPLLSVSPLSFSPLSQNLTLKSLNSQHTHTLLSLPSGINLKLSILVFHSSHMLWLLLNVSVIVWFDLKFFF